MKKINIMLLTSLGICGILLSTHNTVLASESVNDIGIEKSISINDPDTIISEVMTFDQLAERISNDQKITIKQATESIINNNLGKSLYSIKAATYRTISNSFTVTSTYKPTMNFYCETTESGGFRAIKKILNVGMNRSYGGVSKQYQGSVYVKLEDPNRIYYNVNGDFYNNGTTTVNGGISVGVGSSATVKFGISHASNHFKYCYTEKRVTF